MSSKTPVGKTKDVGWEIGVTKTLPISQKQGWDLITSPAGRKIWLGTVARFSLKPGSEYKTKEGIAGEIRTVKPGERVRLIWSSPKLKAPSTLQVTVTDRLSTRGTCIRFHQEKLSSAKERVAMRAHWQNVLKKLEGLM